MQIDRKAVKKILVVRNDRFGEFLLNIPALRALKETFVQPEITAVVAPNVKELAECIPYIDKVIQWGIQRHSLSERFGLIRALKAKAIDMAIMLNPSKEFNMFTYVSGIPVRVGYDRKWGFLLTHKMQDIKYLGQKHEVEYNLDLVGLVGAKTEDKSLTMMIEGNSVIDGLLSDCDMRNDTILIALHPWTSDPIKQWPLEKFRELSARLLNNPAVKVIIVGGKEEQARSRELFDSPDKRLIDTTGKTTLKQLAALLKKCRLLISGDSGPAHLACAAGTPVIVIFRNDIPAKSAKRWGPWGGKGNFAIERDRLSGISVDEVLGRVKEALSN